MSFGYGFNPVGFSPAVTGAYGSGGAPGVSTGYWGSAQIQGITNFLDSGASTTRLVGGGGFRAGSLWGGGDIGQWAVANDASWAAMMSAVNRTASMSFLSAAPAFGFPSAPGFPSVPMAFAPGAPAQPAAPQPGGSRFDAKFFAESDEPVKKKKEEPKKEEPAKAEKPAQNVWTKPFKDERRATALATKYLNGMIAKGKKDKTIKGDAAAADTDYTAIVTAAKDTKGNFTPQKIYAAAKAYFGKQAAGAWKKS